jgi:hypothetical protein
MVWNVTVCLRATLRQVIPTLLGLFFVLLWSLA